MRECLHQLRRLCHENRYFFTAIFNYVRCRDGGRFFHHDAILWVVAFFHVLHGRVLLRNARNKYFN